MKKMLLIAAALLGNPLNAIGGSIIGSVSSSEGDLPAAQSIVVVWVEGAPRRHCQQRRRRSASRACSFRRAC